MNFSRQSQAGTVKSSSFAASMYPRRVAGKLTMPQVLGEIAESLAAIGHRVQVVAMQQPYSQAPSGAGAVKMVMIDPENGVMHGGVSPAKEDYVLGW